MALGLDEHSYSPAVLEQIVAAGAELKSFDVASRMLQRLGGVEISDRQVERLTEEIGWELQEQRDRQVEQYQAGQLQPAVENPPEAAAVAVDGGRLQTRAEGCGPGVHEESWRETKNGLLLRLQSRVWSEDPHPELPACFADPKHMASLARHVRVQDEPQKNREIAQELAASEAASRRAPRAETRRWQPRVLVRTCVSTMSNSDQFGPILAAEARMRGFDHAQRKAFLGDGQAYNWTIQEKYFSDYTAINDFVHVTAYLHAAAHAAEGSQGWSTYVRWATDLWQHGTAGVKRVIAALEDYEAVLGGVVSGEALPEHDPRQVIHSTLTYLRNNGHRMDYPRYRHQGLPVTSALMESLVKQINYRVKGTEKFWNNPSAAEAILQVRAALLSDDGRLERHLRNRPGNPFHHRARCGKLHKLAKPT